MTPRETNEREIVVCRDYDAPRELVFEAWTHPAHISRWWGPRGFTTTTHAFDLRPGGVWTHVMHGPDGTDYPNKILFDEVVRPERLTYRHTGECDTDVVQFHTTVTFAEHGGGTRLTLRMVFASAADRNHAVEKYGAIEGGKQTLERLGEQVAVLAADREIVSSRVFDVPRADVFAAFRDPVRLARWWGPNGFTNTIHIFDLRPGGRWRLTMHGPNGTDFDNESLFLEVVEPSRVVFQHLEPVHRFQMTITLDDEAGKTRLTWRMLFAEADECVRVKAFIGPANEQNFDRLAAELQAVPVSVP